MLVRLLYASRAVAPVEQEALLAILRKSRAGNAVAGVTGVLCYAEGIFMQVLEGGRDAVNALYNRIVRDPRHDRVMLLHYQEVTERRFTGWSMGRVDLAQLNPALWLKYSESARLDPYTIGGAAAMALFDELVATASVVCPG